LLSARAIDRVSSAAVISLSSRVCSWVNKSSAILSS
jgi:hypothetical protein